MSSVNTVKIFNGEEDVNKFITKCELHCTLKGYEGEKAAVFISGKLEDAAFDVYLTIATGDRKDPEKVKTALVKAFDRPKRNREIAIDALSNRSRLQNESAETFAYKISELVKYAYPNFDQTTRDALSKDYFTKGLQPDLQKELRKEKNFANKSLSELAGDTTYLEIAGINSKTIKNEVIGSVVHQPSNLENKIDKLITALEKSVVTPESDEEKINYAGAKDNYERGKQYHRKSNRFERKPVLQTLECRNCNSKQHLYRKCPERFCQACGNRGHDGWEKTCPKYK